MANFHTHVASSMLVGAAYGAMGHMSYGMPLPTAALAGGLVTVGGILPDMDSDNGVVLRETLGLLAAVTPPLMLDRLAEFALPQETIVLVMVGTYLAMRFGLGSILRRTTIHRGMWHSIPAAVLAGCSIYYLCACPRMEQRLFQTGAIMLGYLWHLVLDEIYAVETGLGLMRVKRSFGTALKMWGANPISNLFVYSLLLAAFWGISQDPPSQRDTAPLHEMLHHASRPLPPSPF
jgi:membrane-bound metal-dependent hydrolase YbcI (DUF457 family)